MEFMVGEFQIAIIFFDCSILSLSILRLLTFFYFSKNVSSWVLVLGVKGGGCTHTERRNLFLDVSEETKTGEDVREKKCLN